MNADTRFFIRREGRSLLLCDRLGEMVEPEAAVIMCRMSGDAKSPIVGERARYVIAALNFYASEVSRG